VGRRATIFAANSPGEKMCQLTHFLLAIRSAGPDTYIMKNQTSTLLVPASALRTHRYEKGKSKIECGTFGMFESVKARADFGPAKGLK
jgi:hypothetical protein